MAVIHHTAVCTTDVDESLRFWRDGIGMSVLMDFEFEGDWRTLLRAPSSQLRAIFLGDPTSADSGILELVDLGAVDEGDPPGPARTGVLLVSLTVPLDATLERLASLGLGGEVRRIEAHGVGMACVVDPNGVTVELIDTPAAANMDALRSES